ncbi:PfkB family carbohydrate kinase [Spirochaetota bacterium]
MTFNPTVAVYGGANIDIQAISHEEFRMGDSNPGVSSISLGGVGRNIAENTARLGLSTELVTVFGGDEMASQLADGCRRVGVEVGRSLILPNETTSRYICIIGHDGKLVGAVSAMDILEHFGPEEVLARSEPGDSAELVVIDTNLRQDSMEAAAKRWKDKILVLDPVSEAKAAKAVPFLSCFSFAKPNLDEARILAGLKAIKVVDFVRLDEKGLLKITHESGLALLSAGLKEVYISLGAVGMMWFNRKEAGLVRPLKMPVINVSGAGDAANAAIIWGSLKKLDTGEKAALAMAAAGLSAASTATVSEKMSVAQIRELAKGVEHEPVY